MTFSAPELRFCRYRFDLETSSDLEFKKFPGAELRDAFGWALKNRHCSRRQPDGTPESEANCLGCACAYGQIFNPVMANSSGRSIDAVRPYVFDGTGLGTAINRGERWSFELTLMGHFRAAWPLFVEAFQMLGERGLGVGYESGAGRFRLQQVIALDSEALDSEAPGSDAPEKGFPENQNIPVWDAAAGTLLGNRADARVWDWARCESQSHQFSSRCLSLSLLSPLDVRQARPSKGDRLPFADLWDALTTRLENLCLLYCDHKVEADFVGLKRQAKTIRVLRPELHRQRQGRFSYEKKEEIFTDGWTGQITFEGGLQPFLPALAAGQWLGIGRHCVLGNGKYRLLTC